MKCLGPRPPGRRGRGRGQPGDLTEAEMQQHAAIMANANDEPFLEAKTISGQIMVAKHPIHHERGLKIIFDRTADFLEAESWDDDEQEIAPTNAQRQAVPMPAGHDEQPNFEEDEVVETVEEMDLEHHYEDEDDYNLLREEE